MNRDNHHVFLQAFQQLRTEARHSGQRRILVCAGEALWCEQIAKIIVEHKEHRTRALYIGNPVDLEIAVLPGKKSRQWLGRELDLLIFDSWSGFDVDAFGALSGTLCAGGLLVLLTPVLDEWHHYHDPEHARIQVYPQTPEQVSGYYLKRLAGLIKTSDQISLIREEECESSGLCILSNHTAGDFSSPTHTSGTEDQALAVAGIHKVVKGHRRRPLVLTADRGRGKSAALGIAASELINEGLGKIIVTAPARQTVDVVFKHAQSECSDPEQLEQCLVFMAPDELIREKPDCNLLLVDEAAAIPAPILEQLLSQYSRIVFASTIHGYEGTGRGFAIRFYRVLDKKTPQWRKLHLNQPIRWAENDPLEAFVFQALLLNASPVNTEQLSILPVEEYAFRKITSKQLLANESLLKELFGLLVLAHYQTRPFDLRHMLDGGNIELYGLFQNGHVIATVLAAREGRIALDLEQPIWLGQRRIRGHLLPQSLSNHLGIRHAVGLEGLRIIRIAVHPDRQQQGLGQRLLTEVSEHARQRGFDYLGTSFGAVPELLDFWAVCDLKPVRMGVTRDAASGTHSVLMIKPLSEAGEPLLQEGIERFRQQFHWLLLDELQQLESALVIRLLRQSGVSDIYQLNKYEQSDLYSYTRGLRQYDSCISAIRSYSYRLLVNSALSEQESQVLVGKVLQNRSWQDIARATGLPGRKQVQQLLRDTITHQVHSSGLKKPR